LKLILFSPAETIEKLTSVEKEVDILTLTEANNMFTPEMKSAVPLLEEPGKREAKGRTRRTVVRTESQEVRGRCGNVQRAENGEPGK
jgi:hypothetical protein